MQSSQGQSSHKKQSSHHSADQNAKLNESRHSHQSGQSNASNMQIDLDQLNDGEKQMLIQYLEEEYEKNPD